MYVSLCNLHNHVLHIKKSSHREIVICPRECQSMYKRLIGFILRAMLNRIKSIMDPSICFQYIPLYCMKES